MVAFEALSMASTRQREVRILMSSEPSLSIISNSTNLVVQ